MIKEPEPFKLLTIGGSDSGGAAGIQADLKTWTALGVYGMSVITAVTAQNSVSVSGIHFLPPEFIRRQMEAVLSDYGAHAIKTGFIGQTAAVTAIAEDLHDRAPQHLVIDPVLVDHRGQPLFDDKVVHAYQNSLFPLAELVTPNWREAELLAGLPFSDSFSEARVEEIITQLHSWGARNILITGQNDGHTVIDWWSDGNTIRALKQPWIKSENRHGSGDTLSAAVCAFLAAGHKMPEAVQKAQAFTYTAIKKAVSWQLGRGHGPLSHL